MSTWLDAHIDGELEPTRDAQLLAHARTCPRCADSIQQRRSLRADIAGAMGYRPAPPAVRDAVAASIGLAPIAPAHRPRRAPMWAWAALAASIALAGTTAWLAVGPRGAGPAASELVLRDAVSAHIRSLMAAHLMDVASSDRHTVKPWFSGKLDFAPTVVDLAADGFPLTGGRLDYLDGRPAAALVYARRAHTINLFISPAPSPDAQPPRSLDDRGYHVLAWSDGHMQYRAVSDVAPADLDEFVAAYRAAR